MKEVFISYSRKDSKTADWLYEKLSREGINIFMDRRSILPGSEWNSITENRIVSSDIVILLWSTHSAQSLSVTREITTALMCQRKILPLVLDSTDLAAFIKHIQSIPFNTNDENLISLFCLLGISILQNDEGLKFKEVKKGYLELLREKFGFVNILGKGIKYSIKEVFMPLKIRFELEGGSDSQPYSSEHLLTSSNGRIIVFGSPGSGKSTLLRHLAFISGVNNKYTPVYIRIAELMNTSDSLLDFLSKKVNAIVGRTKGEILIEDDSFCRSGYVVMLDGYDEIQENDKDEFKKRLSSFQAAHPDCRLIISSRYSAGVKIEDFTVCHICELEDEDMEFYVRTVCSKKSQDRVWNIIQNDSRILELAKTPFLLAMMTSVPDLLGNRGTQRALLFKTCIKYLLKEIDWEESSLGRTDFNRKSLFDLLEGVLKKIAVRFFKLDTKEFFKEEEILFVIQSINNRNRIISPLTILNSICDCTGLLQRTGSDLYFIHRSIWEYFVALGMLEESEDSIYERANIPIWEEPIRLYIGLVSERELKNNLTSLWKNNKGLTLRAMTDLSIFPREILQEFLERLDKDERLRLIFELRDSINNLPNKLDQKRLILDTLNPLLQVEKNCQVIFESLILLESFHSKNSFSEVKRLIDNTLDIENSESRLKRYLKNDTFKLEFVCIKGGTFKMGTKDKNRTKDEKPDHPVKLRSFCISKKLVTNALFYNQFPFFEQDKREERSFRDGQPVVNVTWYDAYIFSRWMGCDLPTEAEWEYSCATKFENLEENNLRNYAWYAENSNNETHEVGLLEPNDLGLYDTLGNVREWCKDWFDSSYYQKCLVDGIIEDPTGPNSGTHKVLRGGCFDWNAANLVTTYRNYNPPSNCYFANGFRMVYRGELKTIFNNENI